MREQDITGELLGRAYWVGHVDACPERAVYPTGRWAWEQLDDPIGLRDRERMIAGAIAVARLVLADPDGWRRALGLVSPDGTAMVDAALVRVVGACKEETIAPLSRVPVGCRLPKGHAGRCEG